MIYVERLLSSERFDGDSEDCKVLASLVNRIVYKEFSESLIEVARVDSCLGGYRIRYHSEELNRDSLEVLVDYVDVLLGEVKLLA